MGSEKARTPPPTEPLTQGWLEGSEHAGAHGTVIPSQGRHTLISISIWDGRLSGAIGKCIHTCVLKLQEVHRWFAHSCDRIHEKNNLKKKDCGCGLLFGCGLEVLVHHGGEGRLAGCSQVVGAAWQ